VAKVGGNIYLTGFMGTGKSAVGRELARRLKRRFVDLDKEIERKGRASVAEIFDGKGERAFRAMERRLLLGTARRTKLVVALGGGALIDRRNGLFCERNGMVIKLSCSSRELARRLRSARSQRPLLAGGRLSSRITALLRSRRGAYGRPLMTVSTTSRSVKQAAAAIAAKLK
jgi:shikimate kinase